MLAAAGGDVQTHLSNMHATCRLTALDPHFCEWRRVTCGKRAEGASCWRQEAVCWGGKTEECLFGLVGLTVSPVKVMLQLSALEQMGTNLHLINPPEEFDFLSPPRCFMLLSESKFVKRRDFSSSPELVQLSD